MTDQQAQQMVNALRSLDATASKTYMRLGAILNVLWLLLAQVTLLLFLLGTAHGDDRPCIDTVWHQRAREQRVLRLMACPFAPPAGCFLDPITCKVRQCVCPLVCDGGTGGWQRAPLIDCHCPVNPRVAD